MVGDIEDAEVVACAYEEHLTREHRGQRRAQGSFYTPADLVAWVLDRVLADLPPSATVLDPSCGTGHFLVAAARRMGTAAVYGSDLDPEAVRIARARLMAQDPSASRTDIERQVVVADGLSTWQGRRFDAVVGNPPFLGQLRTHTAGQSEVHRKKLGAYTDTSAVFLHHCLDLVRPGGALALVQPLSVLAARDAAPVREAVAERGVITDFWCSVEPVFAGTSVLTCVPVVRIGAGVRTEADQWGALAASAFAIPLVQLSTENGTIGELASCTADFRDQYYGLRPFVGERLPEAVPLITTGLIDPAACRWGRASTRFARQTYQAPSVDRAALLADPRLGPWASKRLVPKILVAGQGRVIEAVVDERGEWLPSVPVVSVVPGDRGDLWRILAVLLAPPVAAHAATRYLGTGLSPRSVKVSARQLAALPLPPPSPAWDEAALLVERAQRGTDQQRAGLLLRAGKAMTDAYQAGPDVLAWWYGLLVPGPKPPR